MSPDINNFYLFNLFFLSPRRFRSHRWRRSIIYPRAVHGPDPTFLFTFVAFLVSAPLVTFY
ncbi:hypothetical protein B0H13DRAFT_2371976 [Mycena leptocephala]|nr:hypothetical protein B0H13DRAFT_2371976 [Mycena leptocephala]